MDTNENRVLAGAEPSLDGDAKPRWDSAAPRGGGAGRQPRIWYLLINRWKVFRSTPAAFAAADTLPPWRSSNSRRYEASSTRIHFSFASFSGRSPLAGNVGPPNPPAAGPRTPAPCSR